VIINTVMSIASSCIITWAWSRILRPGKKFDFEDIANATLAGGVAVGSSADLVIKPWGAMLVGSVAGSLSTFGFVFLTPILDTYLGIHDTCGVNNLHGMPGILGGIAGAISAASAGEHAYGKSIGTFYLQRACNLSDTALYFISCLNLQLIFSTHVHPPTQQRRLHWMLPQVSIARLEDRVDTKERPLSCPLYWALWAVLSLD
jgi:ammonia channel protein AmtB